MASRKMVLTDKGVQRYRTRAMQAGDPVTMDGPSSRLWEQMGWATVAPAKRARPAKQEEPAQDEPEDELTTLRAEYKDKLGKQAYHGWDADTLREKIAEA
jgi:hypothetical protein